VIRLDNVTKSYLTLRGRKVVFRNFSLDIPEGRNIGLIGRNGAGKSTLMRLISAVDMPDSGKITTSARLSWPVGLTGGLQKNLTGRDNVKFVCRVQGVRRAGMQEKMQFVQEFAEIGDYFDQPVSTYSSGMRARLAFGLSMAFDFDYYLIDEVMSVGDANFKQKSREVFGERLQKSKVILVSHSMRRIRRMCDVVVHLDAGRATVYEDVLEGIKAYQAAGGVEGLAEQDADAQDVAGQGAAEQEMAAASAPAPVSDAEAAEKEAAEARAAARARRRKRAARRRARAEQLKAGGGQ
jgi:capsular polysaccharide transport system ATP-binding protein